MITTYPGSRTKIVDRLPLYQCACGHKTWALTTDRPVRCRKCGKEMELADDGRAAAENLYIRREK